MGCDPLIVPRLPSYGVGQNRPGKIETFDENKPDESENRFLDEILRQEKEYQKQQQGGTNKPKDNSGP